MTIDEAIEELNERIDLWTAYRTNEPKWAEVMKMARDALIREKKGRELKRKTLEDIKKLPEGFEASGDVLRELVEQFDFGEKMA